MKHLNKIKESNQLTNILLGFIAITLFYLSVKIIIFINAVIRLI
jgi:hypothetical protein